jgi:predicted Rossmann fold flavoprotein
MNERADVVVIGAGAAGLMAAIWASRTRPGARVLVLEGAERIGTKILISGGGRCNVTNEVVEPGDFSGSSKPAIRKVLEAFDVERTIGFFRSIHVALAREEHGKLFPRTNRASTVLDALLDAAREAGLLVRHPRRVERILRTADGFVVGGAWGVVEAERVVLATGGRSLPRSGSDGGGYALARSCGHTVTSRIFPALVPLLLPAGHRLRALSGLSTDVSLTVAQASGKRVITCEGALLCTHFGISGPAALDTSRHWLAAHAEDPSVRLLCDWLPRLDADALDAMLRASGTGSSASRLRTLLPERLVQALCDEADVDPAGSLARLSRDARKGVVRTIKEHVLPVTGERGWNFAEVTAGGVPLVEVNLATMESRRCPGLYLCGEICDVDGRLGGFNFQWAWSSGYVAGTGAGR